MGDLFLLVQSMCVTGMCSLYEKRQGPALMIGVLFYTCHTSTKV